MTSDINNTLLVGVTEFCKQTGLSKPIFYKLKKKLIAVGAMSPDDKQIDLNCAWMQNYLARNGTGNRRHMIVDTEPAPPREAPLTRPPAKANDTITTNGLPPIAELLHIEQFEKVRKAKIDNETKLKVLAPIDLIDYLFGSLDDFFIKLIVDGESSVCPAIHDKASHGGSVEETRLEYRKYTTKLAKMTQSRLAKKLKDFKK